MPAAQAPHDRIRELGEALDAHRKRRQALHPTLTITGMYNVLEKLRAGEELTTKELVIYWQGMVGVLRQIHDELVGARATIGVQAERIRSLEGALRDVCAPALRGANLLEAPK